MASYRAPSIKRLVDAFRITITEAKAIRGLIHNCNGSGRQVEETMAQIDSILHTCGVESIRNDSESFSGFWCDCAAIYCNTGDTYAATILYVVESDTFRLTDWGSFVEAYRGPGRIV